LLAGRVRPPVTSEQRKPSESKRPLRAGAFAYRAPPPFGERRFLGSAPPDPINRASAIHGGARADSGAGHGGDRTHDAPHWNAYRSAVDDRMRWSMAHCEGGKRDESKTGAG
jgi:hypothetical protein